MWVIHKHCNQSLFRILSLGAILKPRRQKISIFYPPPPILGKHGFSANPPLKTTWLFGLPPLSLHHMVSWCPQLYRSSYMGRGAKYPNFRSICRWPQKLKKWDHHQKLSFKIYYFMVYGRPMLLNFIISTYFNNGWSKLALKNANLKKTKIK